MFDLNLGKPAISRVVKHFFLLIRCGSLCAELAELRLSVLGDVSS